METIPSLNAVRKVVPTVDITMKTLLRKWSWLLQNLSILKLSRQSTPAPYGEDYKSQKMPTADITMITLLRKWNWLFQNLSILKLSRQSAHAPYEEDHQSQKMPTADITIKTLLRKCEESTILHIHTYTISASLSCRRQRLP